MNKFKHFFLLVVFSLFLVLLISCGGNSPTKYTITWKNGDVTVKTLDNIENIDEAKFDGTAPIKAKTQEYTYTFDGWEKTVNEDTKEVTYTAKFTSVKNKYNVTFVDEDGTTVLKEAKAYDYGTLASQIEKPEDPTKEPTNSIAYTFAGWDKEVSTVTEDVIYKAKYTSGTRKYNVKFMDDDGTTVLKEAKAYDYGTLAADIEKPADPIKEADAQYTYTFAGWDKTISPVTEDVVYKATYSTTLNKYTITWKNGDEVIETDENVEYGTMPTFDGVRPEKPEDANYRYTFNGWSPLVENVTGDATYTAQYEGISFAYYAFTFDSTGGSAVQAQSIKEGGVATKPTDPTKDGYEFEGWYYMTDEQVEDKWDFRFAVTGDVILKAKWTPKPYNLELNFNSDALIVTGAGTYDCGSEVKIKITPKYGYKFNGIYIDNVYVANDTEYSFEMPAKNVSYELRSEIVKSKVTITELPEGVTYSGFENGTYFDCYSSFTIKLSNIPAGYIPKWEIASNGSTGINVGTELTRQVYTTDIEIKISISEYVKSGMYVYFGYYPQTQVKDDTLIGQLNDKAGDLPTETDNKKWTDYNYYTGDSVTSYMWYQDIDVDGNGSMDYRGVYFVHYRPWYTNVTSNDEGDKSYQDNNKFYIDNVYWFRYEPIEWQIMEKDGDRALILAYLSLDAQSYSENSSNDQYLHNDGTGYSNNYQLSSINKWLNDTFYNTAFTALQKGLIEDTLIDNTASSMNQGTNAYACNNFNTKVFLLSVKEAKDFFSTDSSRSAVPSAYALCQGSPENKSNRRGYYWTRSPQNDKANCAISIKENGEFYDAASSCYSIFGVRPALWIDFNKKANETTKHTVSIVEKPEGVTYTGLNSGELYDYNTAIDIKLSGIPEGYVAQWTTDSGKQIVGDNYSFIVRKDLELTIQISLVYTKSEDKIYFGTYPQTLVTDETTITNLKSKVGDAPKDGAPGNWIDYGYTVTPSERKGFMFYKDIDIDSNGTYDYRAVYMIYYRPYYYNNGSAANITYQYPNGYTIGKMYFFEYNPIEWIILKEEDGKAFIMANLLLDSTQFEASSNSNNFTHNGGSGFANNYALSDIRKWLNETFYNTAFTPLQKKIINFTTVENLSRSGNVGYTCKDTDDKMFLLSATEYDDTTLLTDNYVLATGTDYAKCQGLQVFDSGKSVWWLRTPYNLSASYANAADASTRQNCQNTDVKRTYYGVRPCCWIIL